MMGIIFTKHAKDQLVRRGIKEEDVVETINNPNKVYYDLKEGNFAAVREIIEDSERKILIVIFDRVGEDIKVISAIKSSKIRIPENRVKRGRWVEL